MKYYQCPICQTQILYEFDGKKQENAGMRITQHIAKHTIGEIIEYLENETASNFTDTQGLTCNKSKEPPCHLEPSKELCQKCSLNDNQQTKKAEP